MASFAPASLTEYFDSVCSVCNARRGIHWNTACPNNNGTKPAVPATYFSFGGKRRTRKCDMNRNPARYRQLDGAQHSGFGFFR